MSALIIGLIPFFLAAGVARAEDEASLVKDLTAAGITRANTVRLVLVGDEGGFGSRTRAEVRDEAVLGQIWDAIETATPTTKWAASGWRTVEFHKDADKSKPAAHLKLNTTDAAYVEEAGRIRPGANASMVGLMRCGGLHTLVHEHLHAAYLTAPGFREPVVFTAEWKDAKRDRVVPVKAYYPKGKAARQPVILFSHGLGGTREGYEYVGRHWASHGYVSVHLQHAGSDEAVWKDKRRPLAEMKAAIADPMNAVNRALDVRFAIDRLTEVAKDETHALGGRLDLDRIGMAGHSFGAWTTLAVIGQGAGLARPEVPTMLDERIKAAVIMSPAPPRYQRDLEKTYARIQVPALHLTGTLDKSILTDTKPEERRFAYDHIKGADQYLIIFDGADHMVFSGRPRGLRGKGRGEIDAAFQRLIRMSTTAFWDAYLRENIGNARGWLTEGGCERSIGERGTFEKRMMSSRTF